MVVCYDGLLLIAVLFIASALTLPFNRGEAYAANNLFITLYLVVVVFLFYGWFWTHGGQTLGMRAWKIYLEPFNGTGITWRQAAIRFVCGLPAWSLLVFALVLRILPANRYPQWLPADKPFILIFLVAGIVWLLLDQRDNCWRNRISNTRLVLRQ